jgi:hypothetical protein
MHTGLHVKYRHSCHILIKLAFSQQIFDKSSNINLMKIRPVGAELFQGNGRTDRQTDTTKLTAAFRNFAKAPKNFQHQRLQVAIAMVHYIVASHRFGGDYEHFEETCGIYIQRYIEVPLQTGAAGGGPLKHR